MTDKLIFRNAALSDIENITVLKQQVWIATYAIDGIRKEFAEYVLSEFTLDKIQKAVLDDNKHLIIAEVDTHLVGYIEIALHSECPIEITKDYPEIAVLYVLERFCGMGIGKKLLDEAFILLSKMNYRTTWLTVYSGNDRALKFYLNNLFKMIGITYFEMGGNKYENKVLIRELEYHQ